MTDLIVNLVQQQIQRVVDACLLLDDAVIAATPTPLAGARLAVRVARLADRLENLADDLDDAGGILAGPGDNNPPPDLLQRLRARAGGDANNN